MTLPSSARFSDTVADHLQHYVYRLIDPRNGATFYVGKGKGNRVFQHADGEFIKTVFDEDEDEHSAKMARIQDIHNSGLEVQHVIHRHELTESVAFEVEAAVIDSFPGLDNEQGGHGSGDRGPLHPKQIIEKYELEELEWDPPNGLLLINVNRLEKFRDIRRILDQTRFAWRINIHRAQRAAYILSVHRGIVIGAFVADRWLPATSTNFPDLGGQAIEGRWGFQGSVAPDAIWERYVGGYGKRVVNPQLMHVQNPIRYWRI